ncbi:hypothetical protein [Acinetobacter sp.]|uniref:hypothetical protein n=1 Tax=Acinetobacter sp. TaxID=472 RepID=UPI003CFD7A7A
MKLIINIRSHQMAVFDLRTLYSGGLTAAKKHIQEANDISKTVTDRVLEALDAIQENDQLVARDKLNELSHYEIQLADLSTRARGNADLIIQQKLDSTLDATRKAIQRIERILTSLMNEANNAR